MPRTASRFEGLGVGFAPYLQPPPDGVIRWTVGEPGFQTPQPIIEAAIQGLEAGRTKYTRGQGSPELCEAVARHLMRTSGITTSGENVLITPGAKQALLYAYMITLNQGDEAILLSPSWASYEPMISFIGAVPVNVPVHRTNFHPDMDAIRSAITGRTRTIMINSPCNPTGAVYTREEIAEIVEIAVENDLWIISDEIYSRLIWNGVEHVSSYNRGGCRTNDCNQRMVKDVGNDGDACRILGWTKSRSQSCLEMPGQFCITHPHFHDGSRQSCVGLR